jgi:hypothetical protein
VAAQIAAPPAHALLTIGHDDAPTAADHVPALLDGAGLIGLECFDQGVIDNIHKHAEHVAGIDELPPGGAWLPAECGADTQARPGPGDGRRIMDEAVRARRRLRPTSRS